MIDEIRYKSVAKQMGLLFDDHAHPSEKIVVTIANIEKFGREIQRLTVESIVNAISPPATIKNKSTGQEELLSRKEWLEDRIKSFKRKGRDVEELALLEAELVVVNTKCLHINIQGNASHFSGMNFKSKI